jgi:hypothetical protein
MTRAPDASEAWLWEATRNALTEIVKALEPLTPEMQARVLASSAILVGVCERVVEIINQ